MASATRPASAWSMTTLPSLVLPRRLISAISRKGSFSCSPISLSGLPLARSASAFSCSSCSFWPTRSSAMLLLDLGLDLIEGALLAALDVGDAQQRHRELALDGRGQLVLLQGECGFGHFGVDHLGARQQAKIDVGRREAELGRRLIEVLGLRQLGVGLVGCRLVGERQLRDLALLGDVEGFLGRLVGRLDLFVGDRRARQRLLARQQQEVGLAMLERNVLAHVLLVVLAQRAVRRLGDLDQLLVVGRDVLDDARFLAVAMQRFEQRGLRNEAGSQGLGQLLAQDVAPARLDVLAFAGIAVSARSAGGTGTGRTGRRPGTPDRRARCWRRCCRRRQAPASWRECRAMRSRSGGKARGISTPRILACSGVRRRPRRREMDCISSW